MPDDAHQDRFHGTPGVPLGGVGAGVIELGPDGRFRNISINNNRMPNEWIPVSRGTFLAVRIAKADAVYARALQREDSDLDGPDAPPQMRLAQRALHWRGLYPAAHYRVDDPAAFARILWTAFAPIIPFDHEAAVLPLIFCSVRIINSGPEDLRAAALFNLENLCGYTATQSPVAIAPIAPTVVAEPDEVEKLRPREPGRSRRRDEDFEEAPAAPVTDGLEFGSAEAPATNADGHYCLAVKRHPDDGVSVATWNHDQPEEVHAFWNAFREDGNLRRVPSRGGSRRSGAVCCGFAVEAGHARRVDFVLSWYCPRFDTPGGPQGNLYAARFRNALEVARKGLKHIAYYFNSIEDWQRRILASSLPPALNNMLINSACVFSTNSVYSQDGRFALIDSSADPVLGRIENRLYGSFGAMLFFPRFEEIEVKEQTATAPAEGSAAFCRALGRFGCWRPDFNDVSRIQTDLCAQMVLSVCRDFLLDGNLARTQKLMPRLRAIIAAAVARDMDGDGLPDPEGESFTCDGLVVRGLNSYAAGLWVAALAAYAVLARSLRDITEADRYARLAKRAASGFERRFWDEKLGYYRMGWSPASGSEPSQNAMCHTGQLAGQWYADFLGLGALFDRRHIELALMAIRKWNSRPYGLVNATLPPECASDDAGAALSHDSAQIGQPSHVIAHYACLEIYRGRPAWGLQTAEQYARNVQNNPRYAFSAPFTWDVLRNVAQEGTLERHTDTLAVWYVPYAVAGFFLNMPENRLRIMPNLPEGVHSLVAPIFAPPCLGWLRYGQITVGRYRQRIEVSFDSPLMIKAIDLRVPAGVGPLAVTCEHADGGVVITHTVTAEDDAQRLTIEPVGVFTLRGMLRIHVAAEELA